MLVAAVSGESIAGRDAEGRRFGSGEPSGEEAPGDGLTPRDGLLLNASRTGLRLNASLTGTGGGFDRSMKRRNSYLRRMNFSNSLMREKSAATITSHFHHTLTCLALPPSYSSVADF